MQVRVGNTRPSAGLPPDQTNNTLCTTASSLPEGSNTVWCTVPSTGVYVSIQLMNSAVTLTLCEVSVTGAVSGEMPDRSTSLAPFLCAYDAWVPSLCVQPA